MVNALPSVLGKDSGVANSFLFIPGLERLLYACLNSAQPS